MIHDCSVVHVSKKDLGSNCSIRVKRLIQERLRVVRVVSPLSNVPWVVKGSFLSYLTFLLGTQRICSYPGLLNPSLGPSLFRAFQSPLQPGMILPLLTMFLLVMLTRICSLSTKFKSKFLWASLPQICFWWVPVVTDTIKGSLLALQDPFLFSCIFKQRSASFGVET